MLQSNIGVNYALVSCQNAPTYEVYKEHVYYGNIVCNEIKPRVTIRMNKHHSSVKPSMT